MRLGVLDVGSNTIHLLVVDARRGDDADEFHQGRTASADALTLSGKLTRRVRTPSSTIDEFAKITASSGGCAELMAFATSAVRDAQLRGRARQGARRDRGGAAGAQRGRRIPRLTVPGGAALVRRWSAGRIINIDIGGGSLELSNGVDEELRSHCRCRWMRAFQARSGCRRPARPTASRCCRLAGHRAGLSRCGDARRRQPLTSPLATSKAFPIAGPADERDTRRAGPLVSNGP